MGGENDDRLVVTNSVRIPQYELQETFSASGGPGGQHANKAATRVELTLDITTSSAFNESERQRVIDKLGEVVRVVADDERSQLRNRSLAAERMASKAARCAARAAATSSNEADAWFAASSTPGEVGAIRSQTAAPSTESRRIVAKGA